jgi:HAE1 family hydrophobic/amphiphilic exporter-1
MNFTEVFIRRPVMTVLLNIAIVVAGMVALRDIPVAALPRYNTPIIQVTAYLPGAAPETMASSAALPLEKQFSTIAGLTTISSNNTLGQTSVVLEFDPRATSTPLRSTCRRRCSVRNARCRPR